MKNLLFAIFSLLYISSNLASQSFDEVWETDRVLKTPESVMFDAKRNQIYVSNINGKPLDKDNNGFISIINVDGTIKTLKWVGGMHAPKGMVLVDSLLYVTDIDRIHTIDIEKAAIISTIPVEGAKFLNDMEKNSLGLIYISDMQNNQILTYDGKNVAVWLDDPLLDSPNGLSFFKGYLYIGTKNQLLKVDPSDGKIKVHIKETGSIDGLICLGGGKFVVSDWSGRIILADQTNKIVLQNTSDANIQAADLGYIPNKKLILIPTFFDNRVIARKLP